ncbi:hypothetical protein [Arthrobacter sp. HMWF013]|uniref:hypothetical protein n=1 Tax=Arthrobacter sp. HMWF013 TaxID=2056849 RepID=UPI0011B20F69|nr:hypothetical protein [Arthrobacter sp. HMWF013]
MFGFTATTRPEPTADNYALAYAHRRTWVMASWMYGAIIAASGAAYVLASAVTGHDAGTGMGMIVFGAAMAAVGWLASAPKRFTRKIPKPAMDVPRAEQAIRINKGVVVASNIVMAAIILAAAVFAPRGTAPDVVPILAALSVWAPLLGFLILRTTRFLSERGPRYDLWLHDRKPGSR